MPSQEPISSKTSIYKQLRELKKQDHTIFNCLSSIVEDASFVSEIKVLYPDLPLLANLRCGLWYAPRPDGTCYFKSTDGHQGHHQFSTTRLNWHVAEIAARRGGCIIVDATRKGKRAPVSIPLLTCNNSWDQQPKPMWQQIPADCNGMAAQPCEAVHAYSHRACGTGCRQCMQRMQSSSCHLAWKPWWQGAGSSQQQSLCVAGCHEQDHPDLDGRDQPGSG